MAAAASIRTICRAKAPGRSPAPAFMSIPTATIIWRPCRSCRTDRSRPWSSGRGSRAPARIANNAGVPDTFKAQSGARRLRRRRPAQRDPFLHSRRRRFLPLHSRHDIAEDTEDPEGQAGEKQARVALLVAVRIGLFGGCTRRGIDV